jgi:dihydrofolate reductase
MRKLIATVFNYSLDGLLADEGTELWKFCFDLPAIREPDDPAQLDFLKSAYAHIMGRTAYEAIAGSMTTATDHPFADIMNAGRKVVFSRTLKTAEWANTTIAAGDRQKRSTGSGEAATATSWFGAASASGCRSCGSI